MSKFICVCPQCAKQLEADDANAGVTAECPECDQHFELQKPVVQTLEGTLKMCPHCGNKIRKEANFCRYCHTSLTGDCTAKRISCPRCGIALPFGSSICPACNAKLNTAEIVSDVNVSSMVAFGLALGGLLFPLLFIPAVICGHIGYRNSKNLPTHAGKSLAIAAMCIGYLAILIAVIIWLLILLGFFIAFNIE